MSLTIGDVEIGREHPCRFVAEMSCGHGGDSDRLVRMIKAAKAAGADLVKFQAYTPDELMLLRGDGPAPSPWGEQGWTMRSLYEKAQTPLAWFDWIPDACAAVGIPWFSSVFGEESLATLERAENPCYKIARLDNVHSDLINAVERLGKTFLVSAAHGERPRYCWSRHPDPGYAKSFADPNQWTVKGEQTLYCAPGYPTPVDEMALPVFEDPDGYVYFIGLSSHCLDPLVPVAAVARGCRLIEMHFQLDDEPSELEANISLTATQFRAMVDSVRRVEEMLA